MQVSKLSSYWKVASYIVCGLLMIIPMSSEYRVTRIGSEGEWINQYVYDTFAYMVFIMPMIVLWIFLPKVSSSAIKKIGIILFVFLYLCAFIAALSLVFFPSINFIHGWGAELLILAFPLVAVDAFGFWYENS